jgi:hypothetical protein
MIDGVYVVVIVIFFALSWALAVLCDRLSVYGQSNPIPKS